MLFAKAQKAAEADVKTLMAKKRKEHDERYAKAIQRDIAKGHRQVAVSAK